MNTCRLHIVCTVSEVHHVKRSLLRLIKARNYNYQAYSCMYRATVHVKYLASVIVCSVKVVLNVHCKAKEIKDLSS
jgi:hypothetical protein